DRHCKFLRYSAILRHVAELSRKGLRTACESLKDRYLGKPIQLLNWLRDELDELQLSFRWKCLLHVDDTLRKMELRVSSTRPGHVAIHDGSEFVTGLGFELTRLLSVVIDEFPSKGSFR